MNGTLTDRQIEYREKYLRSLRWRYVSAIRRRIDGNRCRTCKSKPGERLNVHHASYFWKGRGGWLWVVPGVVLLLYLDGSLNLGVLLLSLPVGAFGWLMEIKDCITLCVPCHRGVHDNHEIGDFAD